MLSARSKLFKYIKEKQNYTIIYRCIVATVFTKSTAMLYAQYTGWAAQTQTAGQLLYRFKKKFNSTDKSFNDLK